MKLAARLLALLFLPLGLAQAATGGDAGTGQDAPDAWQDALDLAEGSWRGAVLAEGDADWYRVAAPEEHGLRLTVARGWSFQGRFIDVRVLADDGAPLRRTLAYSSIYGSPVVELAPGEAVRLGLAYRDGPADYALAIVPAGPVRLSIESVHVTPVTTGHNPNLRRVEVVIANAAPASAEDAWISLRAEQGGAVRSVGRQQAAVPAEGATTVVFHWDAVGQVGDVTLRVDLATRLEAPSAAHHASLATTGMAEAPFALDLLNQGVEARGGDVLSASAGVSYQEDHHGIGALSAEASVFWLETEHAPYDGVVVDTGPFSTFLYPYV